MTYSMYMRRFGKTGKEMTGLSRGLIRSVAMSLSASCAQLHRQVPAEADSQGSTGNSSSTSVPRMFDCDIVCTLLTQCWKRMPECHMNDRIPLLVIHNDDVGATCYLSVPSV